MFRVAGFRPGLQDPYPTRKLRVLLLLLCLFGFIWYCALNRPSLRPLSITHPKLSGCYMAVWGTVPLAPCRYPSSVPTVPLPCPESVPPVSCRCVSGKSRRSCGGSEHADAATGRICPPCECSKALRLMLVLPLVHQLRARQWHAVQDGWAGATCSARSRSSSNGPDHAVDQAFASFWSRPASCCIRFLFFVANAYTPHTHQRLW